MSADRHSDQRAFPRLPVHLAVRYHSGADLAESFIESLSAGGVFVKTSRPLPIGTELTLEIQIDDQADQPPIRLNGRVVWERLIGREDGMGVAFTEPLPARLKNLLTAKVA